MLRSPRLRKLSQKAKEIAEAMVISSSNSPSTDGKSTPRSSGKGKTRAPKQSVGHASTAKLKIGGKKGRAMVNPDGNEDIGEVEITYDGAQDGDDDENTLYCTCLGKDDHTPMIQCEGCENWFHFSCIKLDAAEAQRIEVFYCNLCQASGTGPTRTIGDPTPQHTTPVASAPEPRLGPSHGIEGAVGSGSPPQEEGVVPESRLHYAVPSADECPSLEPHSPGAVLLTPSGPTNRPPSLENPQEGTGSDMAVGTERVRTCSPPKSTRRKLKKAEGLSSEGEGSTGDEDFTGEDFVKPSLKKRKIQIQPGADPRRPGHNGGLPATTSSSTAPSTPTRAVMGSEKTRRACVEQFYKLFEPVFSYEPPGEGAGTTANVAALGFAEAVESELFDCFGEMDSQSHKLPRRQYMTKLRSLLSNLKHNPTFLNNLGSSSLSPKLIVHMSSKDLQTPEQKALEEQVRQRSLQDSVRTLTVAPKAKMTHKGEEAIEVPDPTKAEPDDEARGVPAAGGPPQGPNPVAESSRGGCAQSASPGPPTNWAQSPPPNRDQRAGARASAPSGCPSQGASNAQPVSGESFARFDLESVFAAMRSVPAPTGVRRAAGGGGDVATGAGSEDSMDLEKTPEGEEPPGTNQTSARPADDYDPFAVPPANTDAALAAVLHNDSAARTSASTQAIQVQATPSAPPSPTLGLHAPVVWTGQVLTADAGGFAAEARQVGGRFLSPDRGTWSRILGSDTLAVVGRLGVPESTRYLVQSHFAATRELALLALSPNLINGPPGLPSPRRAALHHQHLIHLFARKHRHAVVAVSERGRRLVRDMYLVPLLRHDPLPEFVQLLDEVSIPESARRSEDMLLAVLVLQKGAVPSGWRPPVPEPPPPRPAALSPPGPPSLPSSLPGPSSSAPLNPLSILQSLRSAISGAPTLPLAMLPHLPLPAPAPAPVPAPAPTPGPPPGFVPYVCPPAGPPPALGPPSSGLDLSALDVGALQALLSNHQHSLGPPGQSLPPPSSQLALQPSFTALPPPLPQSSDRAPSLPLARPACLPPNPVLANASWSPPKALRVADGRDKKKGLLRMGEVIRGSEDRRKSAGGRPRRSQEFVAPARDGGWAGRGRARAMNRSSQEPTRNGGDRAMRDEYHGHGHWTSTR